MFFSKKTKCERCKSEISSDFSFCPYCGLSLIDADREMRDFGMLGRSDHIPINQQPTNTFGITGHIMDAMMSSLVKSLDKQFKEAEKMQSKEKAQIRAIPNGISIRIGPVQCQRKRSPSQVTKKIITEEQIKKMSSLPRTTAKSKIRRLSDRVICELSAEGIESPNDVFISKLESGYEIKAIGNKKVYVNSIPLELPIHGFSFDSETLFVEFLSQSQ